MKKSVVILFGYIKNEDRKDYRFEKRQEKDP